MAKIKVDLGGESHIYGGIVYGPETTHVEDKEIAAALNASGKRAKERQKAEAANLTLISGSAEAAGSTPTPISSVPPLEEDTEEEEESEEEE